MDSQRDGRAPLGKAYKQSFTGFGIPTTQDSGNGPHGAYLRRLRLHDAARRFAEDIGHRCPDCGDVGAWDQWAYGDDITAPEAKRTEGIPAVVCQTCGQVISRSWKPRQAMCGRLAAGDVQLVWIGRALRLRGVYFCNDAWACPRCASGVAGLYGTTLHACNLGFRDEHPGGEVYMLNDTVPHRERRRRPGVSPTGTERRTHDIFKLEVMRRTVSRAYQTTITGKSWRLARQRWGIRDAVRCIEVTHGPNGWHPHVHALIFCERRLSDDELEQLRRWHYGRWSRAVRRRGYGRPDPERGVTVEVADRAGRYLAKMGLASELTGGAYKSGRCAKCSDHVEGRWLNGRRRCSQCGHELNRTQFQILEDIAAHNTARDRHLFREFRHDMKGARRLTWARWKGSLAIRERYGEWVRDVRECRRCRGSGICSLTGDGCERCRGSGKVSRLRPVPRENTPGPALNLTRAWEWLGRDVEAQAAVREAFRVGDRHALHVLLDRWYPDPKPPLAAFDHADPPPPPPEHLARTLEVMRYARVN